MADKNLDLTFLNNMSDILHETLQIQLVNNAKALKKLCRKLQEKRESKLFHKRFWKCELNKSSC